MTHSSVFPGCYGLLDPGKYQHRASYGLFFQEAGANPLQLREELARRRADKAQPDAYAALTVEKAMRAVANETDQQEREITR